MFVCKHCADIGWRQLTQYVAPPLVANVPARQLVVAWWRPCPKQCDASITQRVPYAIIANPSSDLVHPKDTKIIRLPPVSACHKCRNFGACATKVSIRDKIVIVWEPCFECDSILHRAPFLGPTAGPSFDFALDLELANTERPPRPNPRI
jgi:hypothetical protein